MKLLKTLLLLLVLALGALFGVYLYNDSLLDFPFAKRSRVVPIEKPAENAASLPQPMPPRYVVEAPKNPAVPEIDSASPAASTPTSAPASTPRIFLPTALEEGDAYLKKRLPQLVSKKSLLLLLSFDHFIQKLVLLVDQLPNKSINRLYLPFNPPTPGFKVRGEEKLVISPDNAQRYEVYVQLAEAIPDQVLLDLYRGLYPLFQKAYQELGYPEGYFNDRLVEVINHLLETPEPKQPIALIPHVMRYKYADPKLEKLSAGRKILLRMGQDNAQRIKQKLEVFRNALVEPTQN